jgi:hypothetical protein
MYFYTTTNTNVIATYNGQLIIANEVVKSNQKLENLQDQNSEVIMKLEEIRKLLEKIYR